MASRRVTKATVDWAAFAKKVPDNQIAQFNAFKAKSDSYAAKAASLPSSLPAINWAQYENRVSIPGMTAEFKKQYEALTIPYPADSYSAKIDAQEKTAMAQVAEYVKDCKQQEENMKAELARISAMMPLEEMNLEEYFDAFPDQALDPFNKPTMWPHTEETQPEYLEQMAKEGKFDEGH